MRETDLVRTDQEYYSPPAKPVEVQLDEYPYITIVGEGAPGKEAHRTAIQALFSLAYAVKSAYKAKGQDFTIAKLEGLWWFLDESKHFGEVPPEQWQWKLLIRMPNFVTSDVFKSVKQSVLEEKNEPLQVTDNKLENFHEGLCVQMMHIGPYATEIETTNQIFAYMEAQSYIQNGKHHEIYITDVSENPEQAKTVLRYPVKLNPNVS
jgi:hypothetical protein